jgi:hypothetical protein
MNIRAGYGSRELHLRQEWSEVRKLFGNPEKMQKTDGFRVYCLYPQLGFDCIVSERSGKVLSLFFHRPSDDRVQSFPVRTEANIALGDALTRLVASYPMPDRRSEGFLLSDGTFVGPWLSFDDGIGFHLDSDNRVQTISIFAPVRRHAAKPADIATLPETRLELQRAG